MRFSISRSALLKAIQKIIGVVPSKTPSPILGNLLFELKPSESPQRADLNLTATDLEVLIKTSVPVEVEEMERNSVTIPAKFINEIVRELDPESEIKITTYENYMVELVSNSGVYKIAGMSAEEFPSLPVNQIEGEMEVDSGKITRMIEKVLFAVSTDELRPTLTGVLFQIGNQQLTLVATDGHRLVRIIDKNFSLKEGMAPRDIIVPPKALTLLIRNLQDGEERIKISLGQNYIVFDLDNTQIYSRLIEGEYPPYERVIPIDNDKRFIAKKDLLNSSVKRAAIFASSITHQIKFSLKKDSLEISSEDVESGGEAKEVIPIKYEGEEMEIGYNAVYIMDILRHIDTEEVIFDLKTPTTAGIVSPANQLEGEDLIMLIMPIKLHED